MNKITTPLLSVILFIGMSLSVFANPVNQAANRAQASRIWLNIVNPSGATAQTAIVYFSQCTTIGIDKGYDTELTKESNVVSAYSRQNNINFSIQGRPSFNPTDAVALGYVASVAGTHSIYIDHCDGAFAQGQKVYIKDQLTGTTTQIGVKTKYSFTTEKGRFDDRFVIVYQDQATMASVDSADNKPVIIRNKDEISINTASADIVAVTVYDTNGRRIFAERGINAPEYSITSLTPSNNVLIVEVMTTVGRVTKKVVY